jgi:hypothetical protein
VEDIHEPFDGLDAIRGNAAEMRVLSAEPGPRPRVIAPDHRIQTAKQPDEQDRQPASALSRRTARSRARREMDASLEPRMRASSRLLTPRDRAAASVAFASTVSGAGAGWLAADVDVVIN